MKKHCLTLLGLAFGYCAFAATVFDVRDFGARGNGSAKDTFAVQKAIDAATAAGGGEVLLPAGTYLCGTVYLKDNVDLHLAAGATLKGSPDRVDYCAADFTPQNWASPPNGDNTSGGHLLVAVGRQHVTVRGPGKVDGNGPAFLLDRDGKQWPNWKKGIPWRPGQMVWICDCEDVRITDVELADSPYWTCNLLNCERVTIRGCYVHNERKAFRTWNGDGIDVDRCRYVSISDCRIDTEDDCITLRASCGKRLLNPKDCAFVTVANCNLSSSCNAIRLGVGEGRIHDAAFSNLVVSDTGFAINCVGAYGKGNRGTDITGIRFSNLRIDARQFLWMHHRHATVAVFDDIVFDGVTGKVRLPSVIEMKATKPATRIGFVNVDLPMGVRVKNAETSFAGGTFREVVAPVSDAKFPAKAYHLEREQPVSVTTNANGTILVDFGKDAYGWLEFNSPVAGKYDLLLGEIVRDGSVWRPPLKSNIRCHRLSGRTEPGLFRVPLPVDWRNTSVEAGALLTPPEIGVIAPFRAAELAYGPFNVLEPGMVTRVTVRYGYDLGESSFRCSDERLNRLWDYLKHSVSASTAFGLFVDGDRERLPYEGDAFGTQLASYAAFSDTEIVRATFEHLMEHPTWPTEGKYCMVFMAWHDWKRTGKTDLLEKWYDKLVADKLFGEKCRDDGLVVAAVEQINPDWPRCERDGYDIREVSAEVSAYYYAALVKMSEIAAALGKTSDAADFAARAKRVAAAFDRMFFDASTGLYVDSEGSRHSSLHANALAVAFGLVPEARRAKIADFIEMKLRQCSPYFMLYVLEALRVCGRERAIYDALLADDERSWLGMIDFGATMGMESWNLKVKPNLDVNHSWAAVPLHFFSSWILGVGSGETAKPHLGPLQWAEGKVPTESGPVTVRAERQANGDVKIDVRR